MGVELERLRAICREWGGDIIQLPSEELYAERRRKANYYESPSSSESLGIDFRRRRIYYGPVEPPWPDIIHEMGHTFACRRNPNWSDEYDFLGWEYALARHIAGCMTTWRKVMGDYQVIDDETKRGSALGELARWEFRRVMLDRLSFARKNGLLDGLKPRAIR